MTIAAPSAVEAEYGTILGIGRPDPRLTWRSHPDWAEPAVQWEVESTGSSGSFVAVFNGADHRLVPWVGSPLVSRESRQLRVRARFADSGTSDWSAPTAIEAGLLHPADWRAAFVGPSDQSVLNPVLRRDFTVAASARTARLHTTFLGIGDVRINGVPVSDRVLDPGWQSYDHRLVVRTTDISGLLVQGLNTIEIRLGPGWFAGRLGFAEQRALYGREVAALAQLEWTDETGSVGSVQTAPDWRWIAGPTTSSDLYDGESYDSRREALLASQPASGWAPVRTIHRDLGTLEAATAPPVRRTEELAPVAILRTPSGRSVVDFGQNIAGWTRITAAGPRGTTITLRHAEVLEHGELGIRPLRTAAATDVVVLDGNGLLTWEPSFTYHGFRYVEIEGWPDEDVDLAGVTAIAVHTDMQRTGWFSTSHAGLDRLHRNVVWSIRSNFVSLPTDCPQRDERLGWTGDIAVFAPTAAYLYNTTGLLQSWLRDLMAEQDTDGKPPHFVPNVPLPEHLLEIPMFQQPATAVWGDATTMVPFALYDETGDTALLAAQFESMRRWVDLVETLAGPSRIWDQGFQFGDWLDPAAPPEAPAQGLTDPALVATAYFAHSAGLVATAARLLGSQPEAQRYDALAQDVRSAFAARFWTSEERLSSDSQTAYAVAVNLRLLDDRAMRAAGRRLVELVRAAGHRIGTGFVGTPLVLDALTGAGALDDAYRLLLQTQAPSWLYAVDLGATTIWERWDSMLPDGSINPGEMTSFNHYAFGAVAAWLHSTVGGLSSLEPGWRRLRVAPRPGGDVRDARTAHLTPFGLAEVDWRLDEHRLHLRVVVPPETIAVVDLPGSEPAEIESGTHHFDVPWTTDEHVTVDAGTIG